MEAMYRLISKPIIIRKSNFSGSLFIDGSTTDNCFIFRFVFDRRNEMAPLLITIKAGRKRFIYFCNRRDLTNSEVKTHVIYPEFQINKGFKIVSIESLVESSFIDYNTDNGGENND